MAKIELMGKFTAIGMRTSVAEHPTALVINTCSDNDTAERGDYTRWSWSNPTNQAFGADFIDADGKLWQAVSTECLWQGLKLTHPDSVPDTKVLQGQWRLGKGRRPIGHWNGISSILGTPGAARRAIYIPAFARQIEGWVAGSLKVRETIIAARNHRGPVFLRDFDTGRGVERNGPMSHAWVLASYLNTGEWPNA